jgi:7,8-dihydroneopterin aldolase/epimerase/oxygenase
MLTSLHISGIECYAFHGCLPSEALIGGNFIVDVIITGEFSKAMLSDDLNDTVDYAMVHEIVRTQMSIRSKLIEHVAGRILENLHQVIKGPRTVRVEVTKLNPPVNGQVRSSCFIAESTEN